MKIIHADNVEANKTEIIEAIKRGDIFIYPTDTIYGMGCNATIESAVKKVRDIKKRNFTNPLSVIALTKEWIVENCVVEDDRLLEKLPGPYTLIFHRKKKEVVAPSINPNDDSLGVRIIHYWFQKYVTEAGVPFVTTSANLSGDKYMQKFKDLPEDLKNSVDYIIYEGERKGVPSEKLDYAHTNLPNISTRKNPK